VVTENVRNEQLSLSGEIIGRNEGVYVPILPGREHSYKQLLVDKYRGLRWNFTQESPKLIYEVYADNAPCVKGEVPFRKILLIKDNEFED